MLGGAFALLAIVLVLAGIRSNRRMRATLSVIAGDEAHRDEPGPDGLLLVGVGLIVLAALSGALVVLNS